MLAVIDKDGDGAVTLEELIMHTAALFASRTGNTAAMQSIVFEMIDVNKDGMVSKEELAQFIQVLLRHNGLRKEVPFELQGTTVVHCPGRTHLTQLHNDNNKISMHAISCVRILGEVHVYLHTCVHMSLHMIM